MTRPDWGAWARFYDEEARASEGAAAVDALVEAGRLFAERLDAPEEAEARWRAANRVLPDDRRPIQALADLYEARGDWGEARRWLSRLQTLIPNEEASARLEVLARLGALEQDQLHDEDAAFTALREAILLAPEDPLLLARLRLALPEDDPKARADLLRRRPRPEGAEARLKTQRQIARLESQAGEARAARAAWSATLDLAPADEEALLALSTLGAPDLPERLARANRAGARGQWGLLAALCGEDPEALLAEAARWADAPLARRLLAERAEALEAWAEAAALWPREADEDDWRWILAVERAGRLDEARGAAAELAAIRPEWAPAEATLRRLDPRFERLRAAGPYAADGAEHEGDLEEALRLTRAPMDQARLLGRMGRWREALEVLEAMTPSEAVTRARFEATLRAGDERAALDLLMAEEALSPTQRRLALHLAQALGEAPLEVQLLEREALHAEGSRRAALLLRLAELAPTPARVDLLREVLALTPETRAAHRGLGRIYFEAGDWGSLADLYQEELRVAPLSEPERVDRLRRLAELYEYRLDRPAAASECYEALLQHAPDTAVGGLERIYERTARPKALAAVLARRAERAEDPQEAALAYLRYAELIHERVGDDEGAMEAYRRALDLDPELTPAALALERIVLKRPAEAAAFYEAALQQGRPFEAASTLEHKRALSAGRGGVGPWAALREAFDDGDAHALGARLSAMAREFEGPESEALAALALTLTRGHEARREVVAALGEDASWEARLEADPKAWAAWAAASPEGGRALAAWRAGQRRAAAEDWSGAEIAYRAALEVDEGALPALLGLAELESDPRRRAEALARVAARAESPTLQAYAEAERGYLLERRDPEAALAAFVRAFEIDEEAIEPARRALGLDPQDPELRRALIARCLGAPCTPKEELDLLRAMRPLLREGEARDALRRIVELDPLDQAARAELGRALIEEGAIAEGEALLDEVERALDLEGMALEPLIQFGRLLASTRPQTSQRLLRRAVSFLDEEGLALEALAEVALERGDARAAESAYHRMERVVELPLRRVIARAGRARALKARGQAEEARALIRAALKWASVEGDEAAQAILRRAR